MPQTPLNGLGLTVELNLGLEKSGKSRDFILSGKWQPCKMLKGKYLVGLLSAHKVGLHN